MKHNALQKVIQFIFKYIWLFCFVLVILELVSTGNAAIILTKQTSQAILQSVCDEVSGRVDGVLRLLTGQILL